MKTLDRIQSEYAGSNIVILGNAHNLEKENFDKNNVYIVLNSGLSFFHNKDIEAVFYWVQDIRFISKKKYLYEPYINRAKYLFFNADAYSIIKAIDSLETNKTFFIPSLGYSGFSYILNNGFYYGYNAAYGALQLAFFLKPSKVTLLGVELDYSLQKKRYYENAIGYHLDLHVLEKQIYFLNYARSIFSKNNINITFSNNKSKINRFLMTKNYIE